jgi:hypothetical protein
MLVFALLMVAAVAMILVGHYERRIRVIEANPQTRIRIVPRTLYDQQLGVSWSTENDEQHGAIS